MSDDRVPIFLAVLRDGEEVERYALSVDSTFDVAEIKRTVSKLLALDDKHVFKLAVPGPDGVDCFIPDSFQPLATVKLLPKDQILHAVITSTRKAKETMTPNEKKALTCRIKLGGIIKCNKNFPENEAKMKQTLMEISHLLTELKRDARAIDAIDKLNATVNKELMEDEDELEALQNGLLEAYKLVFPDDKPMPKVIRPGEKKPRKPRTPKSGESEAKDAGDETAADVHVPKSEAHPSKAQKKLDKEGDVKRVRLSEEPENKYSTPEVKNEKEKKPKPANEDKKAHAAAFASNPEKTAQKGATALTGMNKAPKTDVKQPIVAGGKPKGATAGVMPGKPHPPVAAQGKPQGKATDLPDSSSSDESDNESVKKGATQEQSQRSKFKSLESSKLPEDTASDSDDSDDSEDESSGQQKAQPEPKSNTKNNYGKKANA